MMKLLTMPSGPSVHDIQGKVTPARILSGRDPTNGNHIPGGKEKNLNYFFFGKIALLSCAHAGNHSTMAAEWVSVVASQLRTMKADLNSLTALNFPEVPIEAKDLACYFAELKMTSDDDRRLRAFLNDVPTYAPEARLRWIDAAHWQEQFEDEADAMKARFDQPGKLWAFLYHRGYEGFRCSQYLELLLFGLAAFTSDDPAVTLARLLLWERKHVLPQQKTMYQSVRGMLRRMLFYYFLDFAPRRFDDYASYRYDNTLLIEALGNHVLYHSDEHHFTGDRYERLDPNDGTHTVQWEVLRDDLQALL